MPSKTYTAEQVAQHTADFNRDGFCILRDHIPLEKIAAWRTAFDPMLEDHIEREGTIENRGTARYYVTLPFIAPFNDPAIYEDDAVLQIVENIVGKDFVCCQLASDTPLFGSDYQGIHSDAAPLFPEMPDLVVPPFQLAFNFPLVDVTDENGPFEVARGTHLIPRAEGMRRLEAGEFTLEPVKLNAGDVMIRDVRGLHRGTPNKSQEPRPMCVIGYSRKWQRRPEVSIDIPRAEWENLSERARQMLRFNPIVEAVGEKKETEVYQAFAY